ncbi:MAG: family 78 glycoside hydrolase catalytic domain, partial [Abitibacteriaceae bacterium]|nr:family 78 glycoside hydrolase catalytic domain [Abditibacteriaceae bacterium]
MTIRSTPLLFSLIAATSSAAFAGVTPTYLRCEYRVNPMGIDTPRPRVSWTVESQHRNEAQTAYEVLVSSNERAIKRHRADLWDSGRVASDETNQIEYRGRPLNSSEEIWWSVRSWDRAGKPSAYSAPARWTTGLMRPATEWKAQWIGLESLPGVPANAANNSLAGLSWVWYPEGNPAQNAPAGVRYFRHNIELPTDRKVKAAHFRLTADDQYTLYVNGKEAGKSSGEAYAWRHVGDIDVAPHLVPGANALAIAAENREAGAGVVGVLRVEFESGPPLVVPIDATWKTSQQAPDGWQTAAFNDKGWVGAKAIAKMGDQPWGALGAGTANPNIPPSPFLRKTFTLNKRVSRAYAFATALGLYELHLNGQRVSDDVFRPGWTDYKKRVYYQMYDVTPLLKRGPNAIGLMVGDGWATGHVGNGGRNRYGIGRPRVALQLNVTYTDGTTSTLITDDSWKAAYGPILEQDLLDGEAYDARQELTGWDQPTFNDASWQPVDRHDAWNAKIEAYPGVPVHRMLEIKPRQITQPTPGAYVFDMGQNMVGWARLAASGAAGTRIRLRFAEMLNPDGTIYTTNLRGARCIDYYTLKGTGREVWEPHFTFHGFRYVEVTGYPGRPTTDAITGVVAHSDTPKTGTFSCSNPMINQLQSNIEWGQRSNFLEVPTDCPQRDERLGWMGDAQIFVRTACNNMDVSSFFTKWMVDVEDAQRGDAYADVSPDVCCGAGTPAWGDAGVIVPWTIYQVYGDKRIIERHYDSMARWIDWMQKNSKDLVRPAGGYGDWLSIGANTPTEVIATAYFGYSTALMAKMAHAIGKEDDARKYETLFGQIRDAFNRAFVSADGRIKGDTQTCYLLALHMNLLPEEKRAAAAKYLVDDIEKRNWHLSTGFVGVGYMTPTLTRFGYTDVAYRLLNNDTFPSWGFSIKHGATTIWERWDGWTPDRGFQDPGMNSFNHYSLGSVGQWMFSTVAG